MKRGHVVVCGLGHVGYRAVHLLRRLGEEVTAITLPTRDDWVRSAEAAGVRVLVGDARDGALLIDAGVEGAVALIAATDHDVTNIEIVLDAKRARPELPIVARLFDQTLAHELERTLDVRRAPAASALAAPAFAAAALGDDVVGSFALGGGDWVVCRLPASIARSSWDAVGAIALPIPSDPPLALIDRARFRALSPRATAKRASVARLASPRALLALVRAIWRGAPAPLRAAAIALFTLIVLSGFVFHRVMALSPIDALYFIVTTVTTVGYGDITPKDAGAAAKLFACAVMLLGSATMALVTSLVTDFVVAARFRDALGGGEVPEADHVIVVGMGNLGFRVAEELRRAGARAVAVDLATDGEYLAAVRDHHAFVRGDGRLRAVLESANVARASAIVAATGDDAVNLGVALSARQAAPKIRCVVRLFDADFARKVERGLRIDVAHSASALAAPTFVAAAIFPGVREAFVAGDALVALSERAIPAAWEGKLAGEVDVVLRSSAGAPFAAIARTTKLAKGDRVLVLERRDLAEA